MIKIILFSIVLILISCGTETLVESTQDNIKVDLSFQFNTSSTLDIITWNLEHFPKNDDITVSEVKSIIESLNVDIIVLQEIQYADYFWQLDYLLEGYQGYRGTSAAFGLNLACLYKNDLVILDIYQIFEDDWWAFPRRPLVIELLYDDNEIIVINNHFKAMSGQENEDRRREACIKLNGYIQENHLNDMVIVLGDLNDELIDIEENNVFQIFLDNPEQYRFTDMDIAEGSEYYWSYPTWPSHIDHVMVTNEFYNAGLHTKTLRIDDSYNSWEEYDENISDHRPVAIKINLNYVIVPYIKEKDVILLD